MSVQHGIFMYDIAVTKRNFADTLRRRLRRWGIRINWSVWLIDWRARAAIRKVILEVEEQYDEKIPSIKFRKFDEESRDEADGDALEGLMQFINETADAVLDSVRKKTEKGLKELPRRKQYDFLHRLEDIKTLAITFKLMEDIEVAYETVKKLVSAELNFDVMQKLQEEKEKEEALLPALVG